MLFKIDSRKTISGLISAAIVLLLTLPSSASADKLPNIVYILADDLGFGDVSCYNTESKIETPHIDQLAKQGMRFTDAHTPSAVCTPTRYGILTGRYCWRTKMKHRVLDGFDPALIKKDRLTVPALLKQSGYKTACVGKWHLGMQFTDKSGNPVPYIPMDRKKSPRPGNDVDYTVPITGGPIHRGFDWYFGISASLNMSPFCYIENDRPVIIPMIESERIQTEFLSVDKGMRSPDFTISGVMPTLTGQAVRYIEKHSQESAEKPFFLYFPLTAPHLPLVPNDEFRGKSEAGEYGDFVLEVDATVGAITNALERTGQTENTLIIFTSDNGGLYHWWTPEEADDLKYYKLNHRAKYVKDRGHQGNAHLRGTKADIWEGGHRVPFIASWPAHIPVASTSDELIELTDLIATCAAITSTKLPVGTGEDSRNILPALLGKKTDKPLREYSVHHSLWGHFAIRKGPWKLIPKRGSGGFTRPRVITPSKNEPIGQLYHLKNDPSETKNVWNNHPQIVQELSSLLKQIQGDDK